MEQNRTDFESLICAGAAYYLLDQYNLAPVKARDIVVICAHIDTQKVSEISEKSLREIAKRVVIEYVCLRATPGEIIKTRTETTQDNPGDGAQKCEISVQQGRLFFWFRLW